MSNAFMALIWWVIPLAGLLGALGYVLWVTQFKSKFESETTRSVSQFQRFQESFREQPTQEEIPPTTSSLPEDQIR
jgi:hypothetical protein